MPAVKRNITIEQGASGTDPSFFVWQNPRLVFRCADAPGTKLSGVVEPVWPTSNCDCDTIPDNILTWACERTATQSDWSDAKRWCASTIYDVGDLIITAKSPVNLTGYTAKMQFRSGEADDADSVVLFEMTEIPDVNGNYLALGDVEGTIEPVIQAATSETFDWEDAEFDLELRSPATAKYSNGFVTRLIQGFVRISNERTRPGV